jgi:hypothetical protein
LVPCAVKSSGSTPRLAKEQFCDWNPQSPCQFCDVVQGNVPESALDSTNVSAMQISFFGKSFLRPTFRLAQFDDSDREIADRSLDERCLIAVQTSEFSFLHS